MLREHTINFLEALVVFLVLTNAASALVTVYAMRLANAVNPKGSQALSSVERKLQAIINRAA